MTIAWDPSYAIGYPQIDTQHQELFYRFNALIQACRQKQGREEIVRLFKFLDHYVEEHFSAEQSLMAAHNYPEQDSHIQQHQDFIQQLAGWQGKMQQDGVSFDLLVETNEALLSWLIRHIRSIDRKLGIYLNNRQT
ncbi:MAG: bacteriohemerythrin [Desulfuromonadaceae bacterium]|jgi:hemerythrin